MPASHSFRLGLLALLMAPGTVASPTTAYAQDFTGTYSVEGEEGKGVILELRQDPNGQVTGSLRGTGTSAARSMTVAGRVKDGVLAARLASEGAAGFLEAQFQGSELLVTLIEPDEHQQPDPSRSSQLTLHRQGAPRPAGAPSPAATATASVSASASTTATASVTTAAPQPVTQWGWLRGRRLTPPPGSGEKEIYLCSDGSYLTGTAERGRWQVATGGGSPSLHLEPEAGPERGYDLDYDMSVRELSLDGERWISTNPNDRCR